MDHHVLRLRNPEAAALVLAEMSGGEVLPLPPLSNCWLVLCRNGEGLELYPDILGRYDADLAHPFRRDEQEMTLVLGCALDAHRIAALAKKAGWPLRRLCSTDNERVKIAVEGRQVLTIAGRSAPLPFGTARYVEPYSGKRVRTDH